MGLKNIDQARETGGRCLVLSLSSTALNSNHSIPTAHAMGYTLTPATRAEKNNCVTPVYKLFSANYFLVYVRF